MSVSSNNISDYGFGDSKSALLSLQFLDEIATVQPQLQRQDPNPYPRMNQSHAIQIQKVTVQEVEYKEYSCQPQLHEGLSTGSGQGRGSHGDDFQRKEEYQVEPRKLFNRENQRCCFSQVENVGIGTVGSDHGNQSNCDMLQSLQQSNISRKFSKIQSDQLGPQGHFESNPHHELQILKQMQEKALAQMHESEYAEQVKQNFQVLFQKVYGIIQQIQQRNEKTDLSKSNVRSIMRSSVKKQLTLSTKVIELSVGKENQKLRKKKFCTNLQTEFDYDNDSCDEGTSINQQLKTEQNWCMKTPFPSTTRARPVNLLTLSKQYPTVVSPKIHMNTARSDRSTKSKGITLVSAQKKLQTQHQLKKPVKITLMQKKIVPCPKRKVDLTYQAPQQVQTKTDKKTSSFSPASFFSSRRVSTTRII